jgi:hypothetical protein
VDEKQRQAGDPQLTRFCRKKRTLARCSGLNDKALRVVGTGVPINRAATTSAYFLLINGRGSELLKNAQAVRTPPETGGRIRNSR